MEVTLEITKLAIPSTEIEKKDDGFEEFFKTLPEHKQLANYPMTKHKGFWFNERYLHGTLTFHQHFQAKDSDIILTTIPKSGTTWLKALIFSIVNRKIYSVSNSPLLSSNPHQLVPFLEINVYGGGKIPDINSIPSPRIFATHIPYQCFPNTVLDASDCKIIYLCRNPLDIFTSLIHFALQNDYVQQGNQSTMDRIFESFCEGVSPYGPFWDHILGYWDASLKNPKKILFLKYEDLKKDINSSVKKMAEFLGYAFSMEEENQGLVEEITKLSSLENLKNLECNKELYCDTRTVHKFKYSSYFRKGEVGDWVNFVPPSMAERLEKLMKEKFENHGLALDIHG